MFVLQLEPYVIEIWGHKIKLDYNKNETLFIFEGMALQNEETQWASHQSTTPLNQMIVKSKLKLLA